MHLGEAMTRDEQREAAIDAMLDKQAITECLTRYARGIDRHDSDLVASAYHAGAIDDHTVYIGPGREFPEHVNPAHAAIWSAHQHYVTNVSIDLNGDEAHVESYWIVTGRRRTDNGLDMHGGRYVDRFTRQDGIWAIAARICAYEWSRHGEDSAGFLGFPLGTQDESDLSYRRPLAVERPRTV
jgi:hypothetical protein